MSRKSLVLLLFFCLAACSDHQGQYHSRASILNAYTGFLSRFTAICLSFLLKDAEEAFNSGDYARAHDEFRVLAESGNVSAQFSLGKMCDKGNGVPRDFSGAARWYRSAAEKGHAEAQFNLELC